jgi:hypothetical protein
LTQTLFIADSNGLCSGAFLIKVDNRSVNFLQQVVDFPRNDRRLRYHEQTVMELLIAEHQLIENKEVLIAPSTFYKSYSGAAAISNVEPTVQIHYPSMPYKRQVMLPYLESIRAGQAQELKPFQKLEARQKIRSLVKDWLAEL